MPPLIETLIEHGPYGLYQSAVESGYAQLPAGYAGKCHLCVDLRRHLQSAFSYSILQPAGFYAQLQETTPNQY